MFLAPTDIEAIAFEGLNAILTICQLPYNYKKTIVKAGGVGFVLSLMAEYSGDADIEEEPCRQPN